MATVSIIPLTCLLCVLGSLFLLTEGENILNGPPERPPSFSNPEELKDYLKALNDYFVLIGRPRFGRRSLLDRQSLTGTPKKSSYPFEEVDFDNGSVPFHAPTSLGKYKPFHLALEQTSDLIGQFLVMAGDGEMERIL